MQIPFPLPAQSKPWFVREPSGKVVVQISPEVVTDLPVDALAAYVTVLLWIDRGEEATAARLAADVFDGDEARATDAVIELFARRFFVSPEQHAEDADTRARDWAESLYGSRTLPGDDNGPIADQEPYRWLRLKPEPNGPAGSWQGSWPLAEGDHCPPRGACLVYVLFDADNVPVYVGSSETFRSRMKQYTAAGKTWTAWVAHPCADRDDAYDVESRFLRQYKPVLNVQGARTRVGAR